MKCNGDCFNCIYPDCIDDYVKPYDAELEKKIWAERSKKTNEKRRFIYKDRKSKGICTRCGKRPITKDSACFCIECLLKSNRQKRDKHRENGHLPLDLFDGVNLCKTCGKAKPVDGYKVCEKCLENNRKNFAKGKTVNRNEQ